MTVCIAVMREAITVGTRFGIVVMMAFVLLTPSVAANHWMLYSSGASDYVGRTLEDDFAIINEPESPFHELANKVVEPGTRPGDGSLFLDMRVGWDPAQLAATTTIHAGMVTSPLLDRDDLLIPGLSTINAWYGWWLDTNDDGIITDIHDKACSGASCAEDEFRWRGFSSGHSLAMTHYDVEHFRVSTDVWTNALNDRTLDQAEQSWGGARTTSSMYGPGFLYSTYHLVVAGARPATGTAIGIDLATPGALWDVDRFNAITPEIEAVYHDAFAAPDNALADVIRTAAPVVNETRPVTEIVNDVVSSLVQLKLGDITNLTFETIDLAFFLTYTPEPREPSTDEDDYNGYATFGGVGDRWGSYNDYAGYRDDFHFWADATAHNMVCVGAKSTVPTTSVSAARTACETDAINPAAAARGEPSLHSMMHARGNLVLWRDVNKDGHVGAICDPEGERFDKERNYCRNAPFDSHSFNTDADEREFVQVCESAVGKGTTFTLTPIGGPWPNVIVMRDYREANNAIAAGDWEVRSDSGPIVLRWGTECVSLFPTHFTARDSIMFPTSVNTIPIRMESRFTMPAFTDATQGIDIGAETIVDVDVIFAGL